MNVNRNGIPKRELQPDKRRTPPPYYLNMVAVRTEVEGQIETVRVPNFAPVLKLLEGTN